MSQYIKLDSAQRLNFNTTTASQFILRANNVVFSGRYNLKSIFIPITFYNVNVYNNQVFFTDNSGSHIAYITPGIYSTPTFMTALGNAMTSIGSGSVYTVIKDPVTCCINIISSSSAFSFTFGTNQLNSSAIMMGYNSVDTPMSFSQQSQGMINLSQIRSFNISINNINRVSNLNGIGYTFVIPVTNNIPSLMLYEPPPNYEQFICFDSPTQTLNISIYDDNHNLLQCFSDFYMILQPTV